MKYFFETYGCQMNVAESAALALAARERGWEEAESPSAADLVLINTCSVRETAEQRVRGRLAYFSALKRKCGKVLTLVLAGCMAERLGENLKKDYPALDYIIGTSASSFFPVILESLTKGAKGVAKKTNEEFSAKPVFTFSPFHYDAAGLGEAGVGETGVGDAGVGSGGVSVRRSYRSFVPIMHGCNNFCSYCIVPYVRGREISRSPKAILDEIRLLGERGVREVTLLGQNVNSYNWEGGGNDEIERGRLEFPGLLGLIAEDLARGAGRNGGDRSGGIKWVRFLSSHPKDFSPETIRVMAENPVFCRHIHLCVQHGSNRILSAMNRRYTREQYLDLVGNLRSNLKDLSLSTDILVGFPGETEGDLEETLSLMEEVKFLYSYMYHYNPREGTAAFSLPGRISAELKRDRLSRVIILQKRHTSELLKSRLGKQVTVLIEGISRKNADELIGRTERDEMVVVSAKDVRLGSFARVTLSSIRGNTFRTKNGD